MSLGTKIFIQWIFGYIQLPTGSGLSWSKDNTAQQLNLIINSY